MGTWALMLGGGVITALACELDVLPDVTDALVLAPINFGELDGEVGRLRAAGVRVRLIRPSTALANGMSALDHRLVAACARQDEANAAGQ